MDDILMIKCIGCGNHGLKYMGIRHDTMINKDVPWYKCQCGIEFEHHKDFGFHGSWYYPKDYKIKY
jgi:hypothetical protein